MERIPREQDASRRYFDGEYEEPMHPGPPPGKPSSGLMACGVIVIVLASVYILLQCCGMGGIFMGKFMSGSSFLNQPGMSGNMQAMELYEDPVFLVTNLTTIVVNLILYILALVAGIGIVRLRPWTRRLGIFFSISLVAWWIIGMVIGQLIVNPRTAEIMEGNPMMGLQDNPAFMIMGIAINFVCMCPLPVLLLITLNVGSVRQQFERAAKHREEGLGR